MDFNEEASSAAQNNQDPTSIRSKFRSSTKLHKEPPPQLSTRSSLRSPQSNASLRRHPSAPVYNRSHTPTSGRDPHSRTRSNAYNSSNSSLDQVSAGPSPILGSSAFGPGGVSYPDQYPGVSQSATSDNRADDLVGAPFDANGIITSFDSTKASGYQNSLRRPPPPPLSHTSPDPRNLMLHRQSQSFPHEKMMEITPPRSDTGTSSPKRFSDDAGGKILPPTRKKSGFSQFMSSMLGSPRNIKISAPENPVHMIHVGYDNETGQFTVSDIPRRLHCEICVGAFRLFDSVRWLVISATAIVTFQVASLILRIGSSKRMAEIASGQWYF